MRVAVLGGGLQGCCIALALAERGVNVTLIDKNAALLSRTAVANEGKVHLGYMYGGDPTLATARMMIRGALAFAPFFARHLSEPADQLAVSEPTAYVVHRDSQQGPEPTFHYLASVHKLVREAAEKAPHAYFGIDLKSDLRSWCVDELASEFNPEIALAAFDTPEVAINPSELARRLRDCIAAHPGIEVHLEHTVLAVAEERNGLTVVGDGREGRLRTRYRHVVNALWDGRLAIDDTLGLRPNRPWLHRFKYGVSFCMPEGRRSPSATIVLGPFGEVVSYGDGLTYLTWYPECLQGMTGGIKPPDLETCAEEPLRSRVATRTLAALSEIVPALRGLCLDDLAGLTVKGGVIFAWGATDIDDPASELHHRFEIGVNSHGNFHSVDPGKLTMAPYFADICAERIVAVQ